MFVTILSGHVSVENRATLEKAYERGMKHPPEGLLHSFLIHSKEITNLWEIVSVWRSHELYEEAREHGKTEMCVRMFCDAGTVPERLGFEVIEKYQRV